ncbi:MAG TPA: WYL domain-containing protein [Streptosporangiaceae bacterium]
MTGGPNVGRFARLLALVPYLRARGSAQVDEVAREFGVSQRQLMKDLDLLACTELLRPWPTCPIDLSYEDGEVVVLDSGATDRPLRLTSDEAAALLVAVRMLREMPGVTDGDTVAGVQEKLERAAGDAAAAMRGRFEVAVAARPAVAERITDALERDRRVHLRYYVPHRDEITERDVDPIRVRYADGHGYLEGFCRRSEEVRRFRFDRIVRITVLDDVAREVPETAAEPERDLFRPLPDAVPVTIEVTAAGRWVAEDYPYGTTTELPGGGLRVELNAPDPRWVRQLALRLGEAGRVVAPAGLADDVTAEASRALANYDAV